MRDLIYREFVVNVPLTTAWNHLAQVEKWITWAKHIAQVELTPPGSITAQSSGKFKLSNGITTTFKMTEFNPHTNWKWVGPFLWLTIHYDHRFEPVSNGQTKLTWTLVGEGFGIALIGRVFAAIYNRNLNVAIPNLINELNTLGKTPPSPSKIDTSAL